MVSTYRHGQPTIGVLAGWQFYRTATNLSYLAPMYRGISKAARDLRCNLLLGCGMGPSASPVDPLKPVWPVLLPDQDYIPIDRWNTDGLIVAVPLHSQSRSRYVQELINTGHPILFIGSGESGPSIVVDNAGGIMQAMFHLFQHGHRKIVFIAGSEDDMQGDTGERLRAYQDFCERHHLGKDSRLVAYSQHIYSGGYLAMKKIMASGVEFTAVLASNDESALGAMDALTASGRKIPDDVAVIGFDNRLEDAVQEPGLSSVHVPLFDIGYRAVELILRHIKENSPLAEESKLKTRLVVRQSCGCSRGKLLAGAVNQADDPKSKSMDKRTAQLAESISRTIMSQAQDLTESESLSFGKRLVDACILGAQSGDGTLFQETLDEVLRRTEEGNDDVHLWQEAISILEIGACKDVIPSSPLSKTILDEARQTISARMQKQHRRYVVRERWTSSRLSLLTAELLTALDEAQIYAILLKHLPEMNIHTALMVLFEPNEEDPLAWSTVRNLALSVQEPMRFASRDFPPSGLFAGEQPFSLTLIPVTDQTGQLGFMAFDTEHLDLYGSIVQQLSSALNTVRLYRQATEGRRLAEEANRVKTRFLSTISHELRTPLNLIVGLSSVVLKETEEGPLRIHDTTRKDIERIYAYAQHLGGLIGDVIDLATLDAGQLRLNMELVDLGETLQMVVNSGSQLTADKGLSWRTNIPEHGPWVWGDRTRLRQVVLNLINNAIKFTSRGEVSLSLTEDKGLLTVLVRDTGLGIPLEEQEVIFDAFRRSERSIALGYPGLGLGLAICKMLVEMQDGTMGLHSTGIDGEGSVFYLTLPVQPIPKEQQAESGSQTASRQSVLVLSDQLGANARFCTLLEQHGMKVKEVSIGKHSNWETQLNDFMPGIIVLDMTIQSDLSWKTLKALKSNPVTRNIPTMLYASSSKGESLLRLDYLTKPIELSELSQALGQQWIPLDAAHPLRTILVVDDEPNTLELHARIVQSQSSSNRVLLASNGSKAVQILQQEKVDLVLLDLQMPEMDGFEVLEAMREQEATRDVPVIVVTGKVLTEEDMSRLTKGVAVVLKKGLFSMEETVAHIGSTLERKRNLGVETQRLVRQAMAYIHEHYVDPITRQDIAQHINISEDYLTYCFRQELGTTPIKYLQRYRVNQAKLQLKESQKTITEIALDVGFSDSGYFSRIFHREAGTSPEKFRHS
ncbi:MAG: substrate-binding domain-containing protein [Chloroflexi bacterium]|nr:substrate-binding domain-containing protein [Chloroflexota bacterium]